MKNQVALTIQEILIWICTRITIRTICACVCVCVCVCVRACARARVLRVCYECFSALVQMKRAARNFESDSICSIFIDSTRERSDEIILNHEKSVVIHLSKEHDKRRFYFDRLLLLFCKSYRMKDSKSRKTPLSYLFYLSFIRQIL